MEHYKTLGIDNNATKNEIKKAYIKLAKIHHPDRNGSKIEFQKINEAYNSLINNNDNNVHQQEFYNNIFNMFNGIKIKTSFGDINVNNGNIQFNTFITKKFNINISLKDIYIGKNKTLKFNFGKIIINMFENEQIYYVHNYKIIINLIIQNYKNFYIKNNLLNYDTELKYSDILKEFELNIILPDKSLFNKLCIGKDIINNKMILIIPNKGINKKELIVNFKLIIDSP